MSIFKRHYTARQRRKIEQFIGPGEKMALITPDARALFAWRKFISDNEQTGVNCCVFRNEGTDLARSSALILAAKQLAWERWPGERLYTYVDPRKVKPKRDPGYCFIRAGFTYCDTTKDGKLIFESYPRPTDEQLKELAFAQYRQQHGIHDSVRLGDLPLRVVSEVLDRAQRLKIQEKQS